MVLVPQGGIQPPQQEQYAYKKGKVRRQFAQHISFPYSYLLTNNGNQYQQRQGAEAKVEHKEHGVVYSTCHNSPSECNIYEPAGQQAIERTTDEQVVELCFACQRLKSPGLYAA